MILFYILPVRTLSLREIEKRAACSAGSMCQAQDFPTAAEGASALWAGREKGGSQNGVGGTASIHPDCWVWKGRHLDPRPHALAKA